MKIALIENKSDEFVNSRLRYAVFLKQKGHRVTAVLPDDEAKTEIENAGIRSISLGLDVRQRNPNTVLTYMRSLKRIFKNEHFDVIHFYRLQPNLLGTPTAFFSTNHTKVINHITGLGIAFAQDSLKYKLLRQITKTGYRLNDYRFKAQLVLQNKEDKQELGNRKSYAVVKGSAVNEDRFHPEVKTPPALQKELENKLPTGRGSLKLLFVSRLVRIKGLKELVEAVKQYNETEKRAITLYVAGWIDDRNPDSFTKKEIDAFGQVKGVHFLGKRRDIPQILSFVDVAVLPTYYREGTPRFLLEAMAMAKPIITTDMPGCNHLVPKAENGVLVEPKNTADILRALKEMAESNLEKLGLKSQEIYKQEFSEEVVYNALLALY